MTKGFSKKLRRRDFLGAAATTAGLMIIKPGLVRGTNANSSLRVGLLGCGGRGNADVTDLLNTGKARVVALADLFQDQIDKTKASLHSLQRAKGYAAINPALIFRGPKAYREIASSKDVDVVVIATPPYFHPQHLEAAVLAGKHIYCEKPVAVDVHGANRVLDSGRRAQGRLSLEVGFQLRSAPPLIEQVKHIHAGALGTIACGTGHYFATPPHRPSWPGASRDESRLRNWIYYRVLSGDIIVEQNIHVLDMWNWILGSHPVKAEASGGRKVRTDPGNVFGHYEVIYHYPQGVKMTFSSTQFDKGWWDVGWRFFGSKGVSETHYSGPIAIYGEEAWRWDTEASPLRPESKESSPAGQFRDNLAKADPDKKKSFVESILSGNYHNQAAQGVEAALTAMLGRMAAYSGQQTTWDGLLRTNERWNDKIDLDQFA